MLLLIITHMKKETKLLALKCSHCGIDLEVPEYLKGQDIECPCCCYEVLVPEKNEPDGWEGDLINQL